MQYLNRLNILTFFFSTPFIFSLKHSLPHEDSDLNVSTCTNNVSEHSETELIGTGGSVVTEVYQFNSRASQNGCLGSSEHLQEKNLPACYYGWNFYR